MVICLVRDADLHIAQLMPLLLTVSCFSKIQIGFTFLVLAHVGSPGKRAVKRVCVCVSLFLAFTVNTFVGRQTVCIHPQKYCFKKALCCCDYYCLFGFSMAQFCTVL